MADISASDVGQSGKFFDTATGKIWGAFGAALLVTAVLHTFGGGLGLPMQWLLTVGAFGAAAYFVAQETGRALGGANSGVEATRLRNAMQGATTNVMIADNDFNIVYMNDSMVAMMRKAESDIRVDLPQFNANNLLGTNIDGFHANPALQRGMVGGLTTTFNGRITIGPRTFDLVANPIFDDNRARIGTSVEWEDVTAALKEETAVAALSQENGRIKTALDGAKTNVMLADNDFNIIYMNESMVAMMKNAESDIKKDLPNFNAGSLMGTNIDTFHKDPRHQRKMVGDLNGTYETSIVIGGRTFNLTANSVSDENGVRLGTSVEWADVTEQLKAEKELAETAQTNARLKAALDGAKANVMLADNDFNIIYMNETMEAMMKNAEADIKKELPNFDANNLMGFNIDGFHKVPAHQRRMVGDLKSTFEGRISIGVRTFDLIANPVQGDDGTRLGTSVEWEDITEKLAEAEELAELARANGRIKTSLDGAKTNMMIADIDFNIIYMNESMQEMMQNAERDIQKDLPNFNAKKLMGTNIDGFHKVPSHQRRMVGDLSGTFEGRIVIGGRTFDLIANPVNDEEGNRLATSVEWADITERLAQEKIDKELSDSNAQVKQALDKVTANVMVADADMKIAYMNDAMVSMFKDAEADIKKVLPNFNSSKLMGANPDIFHKNPSHQRNMIGSLAGTHATEIGVGTRKFTLIASPVANDEGERLGTVIEWGDVTLERTVEVEINTVVDAAVAGDLTQRIELAGKEGFMKNVSLGINSFAEVCENGLTDVGRMLKALAAGDLTERITEEYQGTFDDIKTNANASADKLSEVLLQIMMGSGEVGNASTEIASGSADLSQRTEQQASSLEETAASMEEMEGAVKTNAENANEANKQSNTARDVAEKGGDVVDNAVDAMSRIEESSRKISDIIVVIDEIAFQTNLLALNAAVEAARAGDAGKGFAVVASEVRALAQRSSEAAKDIKGLIVDSNTQVKDGVELVNEAGQQLGEIVSSIGQVTHLVSEIAAANQEQATGIAEINRAIAEMDDMTQQNSALVEETAASARSLEEQSDIMQERVAFFKVDGSADRSGSNRASGTALDKVLQSKPKAASKVGSKSKAKAAPAGGGDDDWAEF